MNGLYIIIPILIVIVVGTPNAFAGTEVQFTVTGSESGNIAAASTTMGCQSATPGFSAGSVEADERETLSFIDDCGSGVMGFNLTDNTIPDWATITDVQLIANRTMTSTGGGNWDCGIAIGDTPVTSLNITDYHRQMQDGTYGDGDGQLDNEVEVWGTPYDDLADCTDSTSNNDWVMNFTSTANTEIQDILNGTEWVTLFLDYDGTTKSIGVNTERITFTDIRLNVTYTVPPDPPKFTSTSEDNWVGLNTSWTAGNADSDTHAYYILERWTGSAWTEISNQTGVDYTDTTPTQGTTGKYRIFDYGSESGTYSCATHFLPDTLWTSLVGWYNGCYNIRDSSPNNNDFNATLINGTEGYEVLSDGDAWFKHWTPDNSTLVWQSAQQIPPGMLFNHTDPFSMSVWFKTKYGDNNENHQNIVSIGSSGNKLQALFLPYDTEKITFKWTGYSMANSTTPVADNQIYHTVLTYDGSSNWNGSKIYLNGVLDNNNPYNNTHSGDWQPAPTDYFYIGGHGLGHTSGKFNGTTKDVMIFNKTLTPEEVSWLYNEQVDTIFPTSDVGVFNATVIDLDTTRLEFNIPTPTGVMLPLCYQVNYTTPLGDPITEAATCLTSTGSIIINGLNNFANDYSFRIGTNNLSGAINSTSHIANTTAQDLLVVGNVTTPTGSNPNILPILFTETVINENQTNVTATYSSNYDLDCTIRYLLGHTESDYNNLTKTAISSIEVESNFTFNNPANEVIHIKCWDSDDPTITGQHVLTQPEVEFFNQIEGFRDGSYGTMGQFGIFDLATLVIVIVSMIGFNRYNPALGLVVMISFLGAMYYYDVIQWQTSLIGVSALVLILAIIQVRKP